MPSALDQQDVPPRTPDSKPANLRLALSDFEVIDIFQGFYEYGLHHHETKAGHKAIINAKWKHGLQSDNILLNGKEITPEAVVQFLLTRDCEDTKRSWADHEFLVIYLIEDVFWPLVKAVQRDDIELARLILRAEPYDQLADRLRLVFGNLEITHKEIHKEFTEKRGLSEVEKRFEYILYGIGAVLIMILLELYRR
jgi:hypothetical protein